MAENPNNKINSTFTHEEGTENLSGMSIGGSLIDKESPPAYITLRKGQNSDFLQEFKAFQNNMTNTMEKWFVKNDANTSKLMSDFEEVKTSVKFLSEKYDCLEKTTMEVTRRVQSIEQNIQINEPRMTDLEAKLESMEQRARSCNLEITNLPEKRGENLMTILENIAQIVKQPISTRDIINIHRVRHSLPNSTRPKNIVVKFSSQITRDNFISASRLNKGITTEQLNIQGPLQKIYINEHLTLQNKKLFRLSRDIAKENGLKFVWVKHGVILVRADDTSPAFTIRTEKDLSKLRARIPSK